MHNEWNAGITEALIIINTLTQFKQDEFKTILDEYLKYDVIAVKENGLNKIKFMKKELDRQKIEGILEELLIFQAFTRIFEML